MPFIKCNNLNIYYEIKGDLNSPLIVIMNGLTQNTSFWDIQTDYIAKIGFSSLTYDMPGQGKSFKPVLGASFESNCDILYSLLNHLNISKAYVSGISFGGVSALQFAIKYPQKVKGLIAMSSFSEMDEQLWKIGVNLYNGLTKVGMGMLIDLLLPINLSSDFLRQNGEKLDKLRKISMSKNSVFAIQNLMEAIFNFKSFTNELYKIKCPTLILNGEYDYLTPRWSHELIRKNVKNSRLVIIQNAFHAFTIEYPDIVNRLYKDFIDEVENGNWLGDQTVWAANKNVNAVDFLIKINGDHTRNIQIDDIS